MQQKMKKYESNLTTLKTYRSPQRFLKCGGVKSQLFTLIFLRKEISENEMIHSFPIGKVGERKASV